MSVSCLEAKPLGAQSKQRNKLLIKESKYAQSLIVWKMGGELRVLSIPQESVSKVEGEKLAARKSKSPILLSQAL